VKSALPQTLEEELKILVPNVHQALRNSFNKTNTELVRHVPDPQFSGTTCSTMLLNGTKIYCANSGDSRCIVVGKNGKVKQLSRDHKPSDSDEGQRIIERGGRIEAFKDYMTGEEMGPQRVWLLNEDVPGLAMSRSLGDYVAQSVGVIPDPGNLLVCDCL
jgi:serine/threonine protein phosphatase PrpC